MSLRAKRAWSLIAVALISLCVAAVVVLLVPDSSDAGEGHRSTATWILLLPLFTAAIPASLAAARRRKSKNNG